VRLDPIQLQGNQLARKLCFVLIGMMGLFWLVVRSWYALTLLLAAIALYAFLHVAVLRPSRSEALSTQALIHLLFYRAITVGLFLILLSACLIGLLLREQSLGGWSQVVLAITAGISAYRGYLRARRTWATAHDVLDFPVNSTIAGRSFMSRYDYTFFLAVVLSWTLFRATIGEDLALLIVTGLSVAVFPAFLTFSLTGLFRARLLLPAVHM